MEPTRKCSKESCPTQNTVPSLTVMCFRCNSKIHLPCYGIAQEPGQIFVSDNIVMICDECLRNRKECSSPKRKQPNSAKLIQTTIDQQSPNLSYSKTIQTPPKNVNTTAKANQNMQAAIDALTRKIGENTSVIAGLTVSVDTMKDTLSQQHLSVQEAVKMNTRNASMINQSRTPAIGSARNSTKSRPFSYANTVKRSMNQTDGNATPRSSKTSSTPSAKPVVIGTSNNVIGKPPSPKQVRLDVRRTPKHEKAIWVSRLHRDTTDEEMSLYIKNSIGITVADKFQVRKLVKKDRDISTYSFVSFRVTCSADIFNTLLDAEKWPNYCQIREFDLNQNAENVGKLPAGGDNSNSNEHQNQGEYTTESKNVESPVNVTMDI